MVTGFFHKIQLNAYFASLIENPSGVCTLADLIAFNNKYPALERPVNFTDQSLCGILLTSNVCLLSISWMSYM